MKALGLCRNRLAWIAQVGIGEDICKFKAALTNQPMWLDWSAAFAQFQG